TGSIGAYRRERIARQQNNALQQNRRYLCLRMHSMDDGNHYLRTSGRYIEEEIKKINSSSITEASADVSVCYGSLSIFKRITPVPTAPCLSDQGFARSQRYPPCL